jgi:hypothetical protein
MLHLFLADVLWIAVVLMSLEDASVRAGHPILSPNRPGQVHGSLQAK